MNETETVTDRDSSSFFVRRLAPIGSPHRSHLSGLDGVRAIAVMLVVGLHVHEILHESLHGTRARSLNPLSIFIIEGHTGVSAFFVLSGFLLALPFLRHADLSVRAYLANRGLRIYPIYCVALVTAMIVNQVPLSKFYKALPYLTFTFQFPGAVAIWLPGFSEVAWSLGPEVGFYLILPILMMVCRTRRQLLYAFLFGCVFSAAVSAPTWLMSFTVFGRLPQFLAGALAARLYLDRGRIADRLTRRPNVVVALSALLLSGLLISYNLLAAPDSNALRGVGKLYQQVVFHQFEAVIWGTAILTIALAPASFTARLLSSRPFVIVAAISFSMFLWHFEFVNLFVPGIADMEISETLKYAYAYVIVFGFTIVTSIFTYLVIERPALLRKRSMINTQSGNAAAGDDTSSLQAAQGT